MSSTGTQLPGWLRKAVIRGDATALGIFLCLFGGLGGPIGVWFGLPGGTVAWASMGLVALVLGGLQLRWSRGQWRRMLVEVTARHQQDEVPPCPVTWIHPELWRERNAFSPELDAPQLLRREVEPGLKAYGEDAFGAFKEPILRPVTKEERDLFAPSEDVVPPGQTPAGDQEALKALLEGTPGRFIALAPRWPVCCGRVTRLESVRPDKLHEEAHYLSASVEERSEDLNLRRGLHGYVCLACERRYSTDPVW